MKNLNGVAGRLATGAAAIGLVVGTAEATPPTGVSSTTLTVQNFSDPTHINSDRIKFETKDPTVTRVQSFTFSAGGDSGWHRHPGVLFAVVTSGSVTVWEEDCSQKTYGPGLPLGAVFVEGDNMPMRATSSSGATEWVMHIVPATNPPVYRIEEDPPACTTSTTFRVPEGH